MDFSTFVPAPSEDDYQRLKADIKRRGAVLVPAHVDEQANLLDGYTRSRAVNELRRDGFAVKVPPPIVHPDLDEDAKLDLVLSLNVPRRHLTAEQRRKMAEDLRQRGWSVRRIADRLGVSVGTAHRDTEGVQPGTPDGRVTGKDDKPYRAKRGRRPRTPVKHDDGENSPSVKVFAALTALDRALDEDDHWQGADAATFRLALDVWHKLPHDAAFLLELRKLLGVPEPSRA